MRPTGNWRPTFTDRETDFFLDPTPPLRPPVPFLAFPPVSISSALVPVWTTLPDILSQLGSLSSTRQMSSDGGREIAWMAIHGDRDWANRTTLHHSHLLLLLLISSIHSSRKISMEKNSERPSRHQRNASRGVFALPENFSSSEAPPVEVSEQKTACKPAQNPPDGRPSASLQQELKSSVTKNH
ncbi:unnamed protein product [Musa acuminata var. zebrina]